MSTTTASQEATVPECLRVSRLMMRERFYTALYGFGDTRAFALTLLIFTALSGRCSSGVVITKFSGHAVTLRT